MSLDERANEDLRNRTAVDLHDIQATLLRHRPEPYFGTHVFLHINVSIVSDTEDKWRRTMETARQQYQGLSGVAVLLIQDFGAQPGSLNSLGYKDNIGQPAIEGSGVDPLPGQGQPIKAGEFIL